MGLVEEYKAKRALQEQRDYKVVKSNVLIQKSRYSLSIQEQKIVLYLITKIMPGDEDIKLYEFKIKEFCQVCGIHDHSGKHYIELKNTIKKLADKSLWTTLDDGRETLLRWIERPYIEPESGTIQIKLDSLMKPYLLQLKERFTQYSLYYILAMRSQYSVRLYELLKSYEKTERFEVDIEELKQRVDAEKYQRNPDFKRFVLDTAVKEINNFSDINISYELKKRGKRFASVIFEIRAKKEPLILYQTFDNIEKRISPSKKHHIKGQMSMFMPDDEGV